MDNINIILNNHNLIITGFINFENIVRILNLCIDKTKNLNYIYVDLKNLNSSNSSVLLFIINYIKYAMKANKKIEFINISYLLLELSKVYNLNNIITRKIKR